MDYDGSQVPAEWCVYMYISLLNCCYETVLHKTFYITSNAVYFPLYTQLAAVAIPVLFTIGHVSNTYIHKSIPRFLYSCLPVTTLLSGLLVMDTVACNGYSCL